MQVAAIQMISSENVSQNLQTAKQLMQQAADLGATLMVLPENFAVFGATEFLRVGKQELQQGPIQNFLAEQAQRLNLWIVGGTIPTVTRKDSEELLKDRVRSACCVYDNNGVLKARYDKIHLFDVQVEDKQSSYQESAMIEPGSQVVVLETPFGKLGLAICYDVRFPELFRLLLNQGAQIFALPSAFTAVTGAAHWEVLLRARAIENQCYLIGANQGGVHSSQRETYGDTMIIDPWGKIINRLRKGAGVVVADIDIQQQNLLRARMPVKEHRRL